MVVVGPREEQVDGSGSHAAAAHSLARNLVVSSFFGVLHRMQYRVPVPNCTWTFTAPCVPLSASVYVTPDLIFTESLPSLIWAEFLVVLFAYFQAEPVFFQPAPGGR